MRLLAYLVCAGVAALAGCSSDDGSSDDGGGMGAEDGPGGGSEASGGGGSSGDAACRTFATSADVSFDGTTTEFVCRFDESSVTASCTIDVMGETMSIVTTWASLSDFVREAEHVGLTTAETEQVDEPGSGPKLTTFTYDGQGLLTQDVEERDEGTITTAYSNYDEAGRPLDAVLSFESCSGIPLELAYDDTANTVSQTFVVDVATDESCGFSARTDVDTYDGNGNIIKVEEGGTDPRVVFSATVTETVDICE